MQHFLYGGSTAARTIGCPAWLRLSAEVPKKDGGGPAANQGTMLHNCMEEIFGIAEVNVDDLLTKGREYKGEKLTQELVDTKLKPAEAAIHALMDAYDLAEWTVEPFVKIDDDIGGSIDFLAVSTDSKTVIVADYKFGFHGVNVVDNKQLQFYALAAATDPKTREWFDMAEQVVLAVIQPNDKGEDLDTWVIPMEQVDTFETEYLAAVDLTEDPESLPVAGAWCTYCPAHATCPVKTGLAMKATRVNEITAEKLAEYLPMAEEVIVWAKEVQKMAHEQLELGTSINGYKLVNKRASRVWNDPEAVGQKIRKARKIKLEQGFDLKLKSPAQLEKKCKELGVDFKAYTTYISAVSSGTTLAKQADPRPAALPVLGLAQLNAMND
jgi:hypothetical protein